MNEILVEHSPAPSKLDVMSVDEWLVRTLETGRHDKTHATPEQCYLESGELELQLEGAAPVTIKRGDLFIIPAHSKVVWNVIRPVEYRCHYLDD